MFCVAITSCQKQKNLPDSLNRKILSGVWELRAASGGQTVSNPDDFRPGNGSLWKFTETEFATMFKDSVYRSGSYSISTGTGIDLNTGRKIDQFVFNNMPSESFELRSDTLKFYYGLIPADGIITMFVKISDHY